MSVKLVAYTQGAEGQSMEDILAQTFSQCYQRPASIDVVLRHLSHMSVVEHLNLTFDIQMSRVSWEQLVRHRIALLDDEGNPVTNASFTGESFTAQSHRYTDIQPEDVTFFIPSEVKPEHVEEWETDASLTYLIYKKWRDRGYSKQTARYQAPCGVSIKAAWTINLRSLLNFLELRTGSHAQEEIRLFAEDVWRAVKPLFPKLAPALEQTFRGGTTR